MTLCSPLNKMSNPTMSVTGTSQDQIHKWMMQFDGSSAKTLLERVQKVYEDKIWFLKDSEDSDGRRAQHNVLERKRRNDLKSSFHILRDHIPELNSQERAPKVVILKKATDYIWSLRRTHSKHQSELERLQRTNDRLRKHLAQLQASS